MNVIVSVSAVYLFIGMGNQFVCQIGLFEPIKFEFLFLNLKKLKIIKQNLKL